MKLVMIATALGSLALCVGTASAQSLVLGATYDCVAPVPDFILESCEGEYCHIQILNAAAPDGHGAAIDMYRSMVQDRTKGCTPSGGTVIADAPAPRPARIQPRPTPNPAYVVGAGAGVRFNPQVTPGAAARLVPNSYYCTAFIGSPPNGHLATMPGFSILTGGRYRHQDGSTGTATIAGSMLEFHGGSLDGQAATYNSGATGRGTIHLYNERRSRTVIDCDGHS